MIAYYNDIRGYPRVTELVDIFIKDNCIYGVNQICADISVKVYGRFNIESFDKDNFSNYLLYTAKTNDEAKKALIAVQFDPKKGCYDFTSLK